MPIKIDIDFMRLGVDGTVLTTLRKRADDRQQVKPQAPVLRPQQPITDLTATGLLDSRHDSDDRVVIALCEGMR